jgi:curli biogenesis system outer membrane secretion channel CsgG
LGLTANEPNTIAVRSAIDKAVIDIIQQGEKMKLWRFNP